jgi:carbonic anhydrase
VFNVASTPFVQEAWMNGQELRVHGVVFDMETGRLIDLHVTMHSIEQVPEELAVFEK